MKQKFFSIAVMALSLVAMPAFAQNKTTACPANPKCTTATQCETKKGYLCPFAGLNLSQTQIDKIKQLSEKRQAEMQKAREPRKAEMQKAREARKADRKNRAVCDSTMIASRKLERKAYLDEIKSILTPEQYVSFLENSYLEKGNFKPARKSDKRFDRGHKHHDKMKRAPGRRADGQLTSQPQQ